MHIYNFEKLIVWQNSRILNKQIYLLTSVFPSEEKYSMVTQMRRAAISISSNIAEGSSRNTAKDQAHFYNIAYGSLMELLNQLIICVDVDIIKEKDILSFRNLIEQISNQLNALRNSLKLDAPS